MNIISDIWSHLTAAIGTVVAVTVIISLIVAIIERSNYAKRRCRSKKRIGIITGASGGLGFQYAKMISSAPGKYDIDELWLIAGSKERLEKAAAELSFPARAISMDLSKEASIEELRGMLESAASEDEEFSVGLLINCAGFGKYAGRSR